MSDTPAPPAPGDVTRILIVANRSMGGDALVTAVEARLAAGPCEFHVLVPVSSPVAPAVALGSAAADMTPTACFDFQNEREAAEERLDAAMGWCEQRQITATGELSTEADVAAAAARLVTERAFDEVIVSTLPTTVSRWLRQDLPHRIERKVDVPVTVVTPS